jgi:uncharacterized membrane protein
LRQHAYSLSSYSVTILNVTLYHHEEKLFFRQLSGAPGAVEWLTAGRGWSLRRKEERMAIKASGFAAVLLALAACTVEETGSTGGTEQGPLSPSGYSLIGTEPFWGGTVAATEIVYTTPENQEGERIAVTAAYGPSSETYSGTLDGQPFVLTLTAGPCSDGMSDNEHAFTAQLRVLGETRQGCANPR